MVYSTLSDGEKNLLKSLVGSNLICFKSQEKDSWNKIFGNISAVTEGTEIEIRNELTETEYFGGETEDVSKLYVKKITAEYPFQLMIVDSVFETTVNELITDILIVQDRVIVKDSSGAVVYEITTDTAIVIKTAFSSFVISRDWSLEEEMIFVKSTDYERDVYSVNQMISEWGDEGEGWKASCNRTFISLRENLQ
jgi:hypothetical protein